MSQASQKSPESQTSAQESGAGGALIILPTYNERENLDSALTAIFEHAPWAHVLVVDDASPDGTGALADAWAARDGRVRALHRAGKEGLGRAYLAGFAWGLARGYELLFEMDADLSHPASALPRLRDAVRAGADVALGSRWVAGGGVVGWPLRRQLLSRGGSLYARLVLGVGVRDLTGGFKCFRRAALERVGLGEVQTAGYGFQIELTWRALRAGLRVVEVPITFVDRVAGRSKMSAGIFVEALGLVWRLRWRG
ncbi:MAG: polyprenol monophosphomannose synthase [Deltaproteobacteria bacterium]|nr:polyprenol monophosphomannose synthase [Deltaproteobacteria bacterium]